MNTPEDNTSPVEQQQANDASRPRKRRPLWVRILRAVIVIVIILILAVFFAGPPIAKSVLQKQLTSLLSSKDVPRVVRIDKVRINPLALSAAIEGFSVTVPSRNETPVQWRSLFASLDLRTLFTHEWRFREIAIDGFAGRIAILKDGRHNFADLFDNSAPATADTTGTSAAQNTTGTSAPQNAAEPSNPAVLHINTLAVTDARLDYSDASLPQPFATEVGPLSFTVTNFQTGGPGRAPGELIATDNAGESFDWKGNLSIKPLFSSGQLRLGNIPVKKYTPYYANYVGFDVLDGLLEITLNYELSSQTHVLSFKASQGGITLRDLKLAPRGTTEPMVAIDSIALDQLSAASINNDDPAKSSQTVHIARATIAKGSIAFKRDANGLALVSLFIPQSGTTATTGTTPAPASAPAPVATATTTAAQPASPPMDVILDELNVQNLALAIEDDTLGKQPLRTSATLTNVTAKNFSLNHLDRPLDVSAALQTADGGSLTATGSVALSPLNGSYTAQWSGLRLADGSPYTEQLARVRIAQGVFSGSATVSITPAGDISTAGDMTISDFSAVEAATSAPLQSWKQLTISGASFSTSPKTQIAINEIALQSPQTQVVIQPNGALNWAALSGGGTAATSGTATASSTTTTSDTTPPQATGTNSAAMLVQIKQVTLSDGRAEFHDQSTKPAVTMALTSISGTIAGLSTTDFEHAKVNISAKVNDAAPVSLVGRLNPLTDDKFTSLKFSLQGADLAPLAPYVEKYIGRKLTSGSLNVDVTTKLSKRYLDSENIITLDKFYFGDRVDSPDATSLPVALAASLLRDTKGQIVLNVPVQGSLDDPNFKYGRAVWRAIGNILVKAAAAPFKLLAGAVGAGGKGSAGGVATTGTSAAGVSADNAPDQDYSSVAFDAGSSALNAAGQQKLAAVAQGLNSRTELHLNLTGGYNATADAAALQPPAAAPAPATTSAGTTTTTGTTANAQASPPPAVSDAQLRQLAATRAKAVKDYLTGQGKVPADHVSIADKPATTGARVSLELQ